MLKKTIQLIFDGFDDRNNPLSNNRIANRSAPIFCSGITDLSISNICREDINDIDYNYGYVITHDYERYQRRNHHHLVNYFKQYKILDPDILSLVHQQRCKIYYDAVFEGYVENFDFDELYSIADYYKFSPSQLVYVTAARGAQDIHNEYARQHKILDQLSILDMSWFEQRIRLHLVNNQFEKNEILLDKKFICLNQLIRPHRQMLACLIFRNELLYPEFYYSLVNVNNNFVPDLMHVLQSHKILGITNDDIMKLHIMLPFLRLDSNPAITLDETHSEIDIFYQQSLFNIISETQFFESVAYGIPTIFLTEKSYKPFIYRQIPIMFGGPLLIKRLRDNGFDVFDDIVDHSYDLEFDHDKRMLQIVAELERLNNKYSIQDCNNLKALLQYRFDNNQKNLLQDTL